MKNGIFLSVGTGLATFSRGRVAASIAAGLILSAITTVRAQTAQSGDVLNWNGGAGVPSWTDGSTAWYDTTLRKAISLGDASGNQGLAYSYVFNGAATNSTVAPTAMSIGDNSSTTLPVLGVNSLTFNNGFAANNTMTVGSAQTNTLAESLNLASGWTVADNASNGTVTFNTSTTGNYGLYITLGGNGTVSVNTGASVVLNAVVSDTSGGYSITKTGGGVLTLSPTSNIGNNYSGGTTVNGGTLIVSGPNYPTGTGAVTVSNAGSVLAGSGPILGATTINAGAILSPGTAASPVGILSIGSSSVLSGLTINGTLSVDLLGGGVTAGVNNDQTTVSGSLKLNAASSQLIIGSVSNRAGLSVGQTFYLFLDSGVTPVIGAFANALQGGTVADSSGDTFRISYLGNGDSGTVGNDVSLTVADLGLPVPEPSTWTLLGLGAGLLLIARRHRIRTDLSAARSASR